MQICERSSRVRGYPLEAAAAPDARDFFFLSQLMFKPVMQDSGSAFATLQLHTAHVFLLRTL